MTETENNSTAFPEIKPIDVGPELGRFMTAMRRLQDIVVSTNPDEGLWADAAGEIEDLCAVWKSTEHHWVLLPLAADPTCRDSGIP